jgi:hypothetical protein
MGFALLAIAACGETTHTVGRLKAKQVLAAPKAGSAGEGATLGEPHGGGVLQVPQAAGATGMGVDDGGTVVGAQDSGVVRMLPIAFSACKGPSLAAKRRELDLYLMVDNNITLPDPRAWSALLQGVNRYVNDERAAGTGIGIDYFGLDCDTNTYATPTVPLGLLPGNARPIVASFAQLPINVSPLLPAMQGAVRYARSAASAFPKLKLAVVLITDGLSDLMCGTDIRALTQATRDGLDGDPSIASYMIAVDANGTFSLDVFNPASRFDPLDEMATAGGTAAARHVDVLSEPTALMNQDPSPFADTMVAIQREAEPCDYAVPDEVPADANGVWLARDDSVSIAPLARVPSADDCAADRYYFSIDRDVRWATLCPDLCDDVKKHRSTLSWVEGCP